jgi:hypothetical protein
MSGRAAAGRRNTRLSPASRALPCDPAVIRVLAAVFFGGSTLPRGGEIRACNT